ncbi:hypothetical protein NE865_03417 [Phthorimaea operculella]|nr:hypothetical protein NE865_03417 [Phthorimaea operculella]
MAESEAISALVRKRGNLKGNITKLVNSFASKEFTKFELVRMQERLRSTFDKYENCNLEICAIDETKSDADFEATESNFLKTCAKMDELLTAPKHSCSAPMQTKLPHISIPTFSGKLLQ